MGGDYLRKFGDQAKTKKHAPTVEAAGATFLSAAFSVLGSWGPAITKEFGLLWKAEIDSAKAAGEAVWPVIQRKMLWRAKISVALIANACQRPDAPQPGALPGYPQHCTLAPCPLLAPHNHRSPAQRSQDYNLAHSRRLCANKHALYVTPSVQHRA